MIYRITILLMLVGSVQACRTLGGSELAGSGQGVCGGRPLPSNKTRQARHHRLECSTGVDHFVRLPMSIPDLDAWDKYEQLFQATGEEQYRYEMQKIGQQKPLIQWQGTIPYQTVEKWTWTDWVYGPDISCPPEKDCWTDKDGKETCVETIGSCWHDEDRHEARHCSTENMTFKAEFVRPSLQEWGPAIKDQPYFDVLPNKYDLIPGESEDVQIYSNNGGGTALAPNVVVGSAWNHYDADVRFVSGSSSCRFENPTEVDVKIHTQGRRIRTTPNAFRMPTDEFGDPIDPITWFVTRRNGEDVRTVPKELRLTDISSEMITNLARQSREYTVEIEEEKERLGIFGYAHQKDQATIAKRSGFWKDTQVRIMLYKSLSLARDVKVTSNLYVPGSRVASFQNYRIPLDGAAEHNKLLRPAGPGPDGLWRFAGVGLEPNQNYNIYVAMYQKGVPFYVQDCSDPEAAKLWSCKLGLRGEKSYYSEDLDIGFKSNKQYDERGSLQKLSDFQGKPLHKKFGDLFKWVFGY